MLLCSQNQQGYEEDPGQSQTAWERQTERARLQKNWASSGDQKVPLGLRKGKGDEAETSGVPGRGSPSACTGHPETPERGWPVGNRHTWGQIAPWRFPGPSEKSGGRAALLTPGGSEQTREWPGLGDGRRQGMPLQQPAWVPGGTAQASAAGKRHWEQESEGWPAKG